MVSDRARQFLPFDALKGFNEAIRAKEKIVVPKVELSDDKKDELDFLLQTLKNFLQNVKKINGHLQYLTQKMMILKFLQNLKTISL